MLGDGWTIDHWSALFRILGIDKKTTLETLLFRHLLDAADTLISKVEDIKELNNRASGEDQIRKALNELKIWENSTEFNMFEHLKTHLIKEWKEIMTEVGDNQSLLQSLKDSSYAELFDEEIKAWEVKLTNLSEYLHNLNIIQRKWLYL